MAALDQDTLFVCFLSDNRTVQEYERDLLEEIGNKRLVRTRVAVAAKGDPAIESLAEHSVAPDVSFSGADDHRPPLDVIFGQLLGLFFSLRWNLRPDCPSPNGAISRVVQNFSIHS
jgi:tagatose-6-phosphate ketose/aldose isomerase